ncbi:MAG TPA: oxaloacetate decarboxylase subunit alpha [Syntrophus sp. (in: bacteria)]|nr:oxaloacetate decarboxylase subunit alpha [Syntrophus sp. (in: bacteria)]
MSAIGKNTIDKSTASGDEIGKKRVGLTDTTLRDAHQSLLAARMRTDDMLPVAEIMDEVGFHSVEMWGGAPVDACLRYLNEDPWQRVRKLRRAFKKTRLQMVLRGQALTGYRIFADDVVDEFVKKAVGNGIDIIRVYDALNDVRNMERAISATSKEGAHVQGTIAYTISPFHDIDCYLDTTKKLKDVGVDSLCIKDMAGILTPMVAFNLISKIKESVSLPLQLHSHCTCGFAPMNYWTGIEAGASVIDTAVSSLAFGASQPAAETMVAVLQGTPYDTGINLPSLSALTSHFKAVRGKYREYDQASADVDINALNYQIPGGMITNLLYQLREQMFSDHLAEVLQEVLKIREELGYPPLVTPISQMVGAQAVTNVMMGGRYKVISKEVRNYIKGLYGSPPGPVDENLTTKIMGDEKPLSIRPADLLEPELEKARLETKGLTQQEEDLLSYLLFPQIALEFFWRRANQGIEVLKDK